MCGVGCDRSCLWYSEYDAVWQQHLPSLLPTPVRAAAEYWSALGRISAADSSEEETAGCFTAKLFLALDGAHEVTSPFHFELDTRPWASLALPNPKLWLMVCFCASGCCLGDAALGNSAR